MAGTIYVATTTFHADIGGTPVLIREGMDRVREGHPLLTGREQFFKPLDVQYDVEDASAKPGTKRTRTKE
jgi:hypothetical protein